MEGTIALDNHYFAIFSIIIESGKDLQWMLRLLGERLLGKRIFTCSQSIAHRLLTKYKGKMCLYKGAIMQSLPLTKASNCVHVASCGTAGCYVPPMGRSNKNIATPVGIPVKHVSFYYNHEGTIERIQNGGHSTRHTVCFFFKNSSHENMKRQGAVLD